MAQIVETLRTLYDYVVVDLDKRLDDHSLDVIAAADRLFVVMTADLSCIKNVRLVLQTMSQIGIPTSPVDLLLNRSNAYTGIRPPSPSRPSSSAVPYQVVNDYRAAISALNSGEPFMHAAPIRRSPARCWSSCARSMVASRRSEFGSGTGSQRLNSGAHLASVPGRVSHGPRTSSAVIGQSLRAVCKHLRK